MVKAFDVLVIGELNVDLIFNGLTQFPEIGKEVLAQDMTLTLGSSFAIFASNISSLGARTAFSGKIGKDKFGEFVLDCLQGKQVDISLVKVDPKLSTGVTVILNVDNDRANITYPGAMGHFTLDEVSEQDLKTARHLHFSSYFLQPGMWGAIGKLFRKGKKMGLTTSFDMQWDPSEKWELDIRDVLPHVDIFLPNEKELLHLTGKEDLTSAIESIKDFIGILVIKRGENGSLVHHKDKIIELKSFLNKNVVDAIGAGDSFNAGFIYKYIRGRSLNECLEFGNLIGAISTTSSGGTSAFIDPQTFTKTAKEQFGVDLEVNT